MPRTTRKPRKPRPVRKDGVLGRFEPVEDMEAMKKPEGSPETAVIDSEKEKDNGTQS